MCLARATTCAQFGDKSVRCVVRGVHQTCKHPGREVLHLHALPPESLTLHVQAIALLDTLDKDVNTFVMRVREWYSWHFPELVKVRSNRQLSWIKLGGWASSWKTRPARAPSISGLSLHSSDQREPI